MRRLTFAVVVLTLLVLGVAIGEVFAHEGFAVALIFVLAGFCCGLVGAILHDIQSGKDRFRAEVAAAARLEDELNAEGTSYEEVVDEAQRDQETARRRRWTAL